MTLWSNVFFAAVRRKRQSVTGRQYSVRQYTWLLSLLGAGMLGLAACSPVDQVTISHAPPSHVQCPDCSYCPDGYTQLQCEDYWEGGGIGPTEMLPTYRPMNASETAFVKYAIGEYITNTTVAQCGGIVNALYSMLDHGQIYVVDAAAISATQGYFSHWAERSATTTNLTDGIIVNELTFIDILPQSNGEEVAHVLTHELMHPWFELMGADSDPYGSGTVGSFIEGQVNYCESGPDGKRSAPIGAGQPATRLGGAR